MFGVLKNLFAQKDNSQLKDAIINGAILIDVRSPAEFLSGSVKGAINIPLGAISTQVSTLKSKKSIVVFCKSGMRSGQAVSILKQNGCVNVINGGSWRNVTEICMNQYKK